MTSTKWAPASFESQTLSKPLLSTRLGQPVTARSVESAGDTASETVRSWEHGPKMYLPSGPGSYLNAICHGAHGRFPFQILSEFDGVHGGGSKCTIAGRCT